MYATLENPQNNSYRDMIYYIIPIQPGYAKSVVVKTPKPV
jgi:5-methylcytosine-specific restriction endonuclease McrBC GTP-binding regulatory subunit McrB